MTKLLNAVDMGPCIVRGEGRVYEAWVTKFYVQVGTKVAVYANSVEKRVLALAYNQLEARDNADKAFLAMTMRRLESGEREGEITPDALGPIPLRLCDSLLEAERPPETQEERDYREACEALDQEFSAGQIGRRS